MSLRKRIQAANSGNDEVTIALVEQFKPLLLKYARRLDYEDAYCDLQLKFLELIKQICHNDTLCDDGQIIAYISSAIKNEYVAISKKLSAAAIACFSFDTDDPAEKAFLNYKTATNGTFASVEIDSILQSLSPLEKETVVWIVIQNGSAAQLARRLHCSRQCINQAKHRGLSKLRKLLEGE